MSVSTRVFWGLVGALLVASAVFAALAERRRGASTVDAAAEAR